MIHTETLSIKEYNKSTNKYLSTSSSIDPCKPYVALSIFFLVISITISGAFVYFYLNSRPKKNHKLIITNINENHKTSENKKSSKLFF